MHDTWRRISRVARAGTELGRGAQEEERPHHKLLHQQKVLEGALFETMHD